MGHIRNFSNSCIKFCCMLLQVIMQESKKKKGQSNSLIPGEDDPISESEIHLNEKRTRFSLSHDQDSIGASYPMCSNRKHTYYPSALAFQIRGHGCIFSYDIFRPIVLLGSVLNFASSTLWYLIIIMKGTLIIKMWPVILKI